MYKELLMEVYVKKEQSALERSASDYAKKVYDNVKTIIPHLAELLNEKLVGYSEESIMLRPGGNHTRQLCALLNENSKRKICGIIDGSLQCQCKNLGYKIYKTGEPLPKKVKAVILSTYLNADELGEDTKRLYSDLEIIDIYSIWEKQGYHFWKDFWFGTKEDWDV